jgi:hypothetical protein
MEMTAIMYYSLTFAVHQRAVQKLAQNGMSLAGIRPLGQTRSGTLIARPKQSVAFFKAARLYHRKGIADKICASSPRLDLFAKTRKFSPCYKSALNIFRADRFFTLLWLCYIAGA